MLNDPLSHGLWEKTAPPAPPTPPLAGDVKADVAVVGCGYTGLSAALHLAEAGARVVALEAVEVGYGGGRAQRRASSTPACGSCRARFPRRSAPTTASGP